MATFWLYVFAAALCLIFRKCAVSYCPVKLDGSKKLVSSFPSAYAMLFIVAMGSTIFHVWDLLAERKKLAVILTVLCSLLMLLEFFCKNDLRHELAKPTLSVESLMGSNLDSFVFLFLLHLTCKV